MSSGLIILDLFALKKETEWSIFLILIVNHCIIQSQIFQVIKKMVTLTTQQRGFIQMVANALRRYSSLSSNVRLYIGCQFALESDYGRSRIACRNLNYCGMKVPLMRISTAVNKGCNESVGDFAKFNSIADCILDYILLLQYNKITLQAQRDLKEFRDFLIRIKYCPEPTYIERINSIYSLML